MSGIGCPTHEELTSYALGKIPEADADAILRHIESCESCTATLTDLEGATDRLIDLCRQPAPLDRYSQEAACHDAITRAIALGGGFADATDTTPAETVVAPEEEEPILGQMGDYKLVEELSHGGMGTVYRAVHVRLGREVALKVLPKGRNTDQRAVARFEREMAAVGKLDHPNIVRATDAGEVDGVQYLAMELIDGFDLTELVDYLGPLGVANACEVIRQAAIGLQCAYEEGLVHRDIKPSNVMVTAGGVAKVLDLGLARFHIDKQSNVELTTAGQPMGTADYMAPEQVADTHSVDIRADIYSLGSTFYKILAGQPPFGGVQYSSSFDKMMAHRKETPPPILEFRPDLPKKVVAILDQMLAKDPDDRFQKPSDLAESLYPLCAGANLPEMIEKAWQAAETAPMPKSTAESTPDGSPEAAGSTATPRRKRRGPGLGSTGGSSTQGASRSQYSNFYVMPPPPKPQWELWVTIGVLSSLLVGIIAAYVTTLIFDNGPSPSLKVTGSINWKVPIDQPPVQMPTVETLTLQPNRAPVVRGALSVNALVASPAKIDGLKSWTLETIGHRTPILAAAMAPDAKTLATGGGEGAIRIWTLSGGGTLASVLIKPGQAGAVRALAWAPGGSYLAAAYDAGRLLIWDTEKGTVLRDFETRSLQAGSIAWSPAGTLLAYIGQAPGQEDRDAVYLWNAKADKSLPPLAGSSGRLQVVAFAPDSLKLAAGGSDLQIHVWDILSGNARAPISTEAFHQNPITALAWSPCATMIASSCAGGLSSQGVVIWDLEGERLGDLPQHPGGDRCLVWLAETPRIIGAGGGRDGKIRYYDYDAARGFVGQQAETGPSLLCQAGLTEKIAVVGQDGSVRFCEATGIGRATAELPRHLGTPDALAFSPDGKTVACGSEDGSIRFFDTTKGELLQHLVTEGPVRSLAYSTDRDPDQAKLAVRTETWSEAFQRTEVATVVFHIQSGDVLWKFELTSSERIDDLAWSPDGTMIATAGDHVKIWDGRTGEFLRQFAREGESIAWTTGGSAVALGSRSSVELLDANSGGNLLSCLNPAAQPRLLAWSEEAGLLAATSGTDSPTILLLAAESAEPRLELSAGSHPQPIDALGWQADGKALLSGSASETCIWNPATGQRTNTLAIGTRTFSADGQLSAAAGPSTIRLQRPENGKLLRTMLSLNEQKYAVIAPDGNYDGSTQLRDRFVYVIQKEDGQATLNAKQFAEQYGWENDANKAAAPED